MTTSLEKGQSFLDGDADRMQAGIANELTELPEIPVSSTATPFDLDFPPGLVGEIAEFILRSARNPDRAYATAGALQVMAYLNKNRQFVRPSNTPLNLYQALIGPTGKGKEDPRRAIKQICRALDQAGEIIESVASGPAMLRTLESQKEVLILSDEFGIFLQTALSDKGSMHLKELVKELLTLFGLGRSYFGGKRYADSKANIGMIDKPYVNLLGTTTPVELFEGLTFKSLDNGFLNRFLFIESNDDNPINREPDTTIPQPLIDGLLEVVRATLRGLEYEDGAHDLMVAMSEQMGETGRFANLWSRAEEQMIRVAGVLAIGDDGVIKRSHIMWAFRYVDWCIKSFSARLGSDLAETVFEKRIVKATAIINNARDYANDRQFGSLCRQGYMPRGKLTKLMKIAKRELDDVVLYLVESKEFAVSVFQGSSVLHPVLQFSADSAGSSLE